MARSKQPTIAGRFQAVLDRHEIKQSDLARGADMNLNTLRHYLSANCKRQFLPRDKPWSDRLRESLLARGCTTDEAAELFGLQQMQDLHELQLEVRALKKGQDDLRSLVADLNDFVRKNLS